MMNIEAISVATRRSVEAFWPGRKNFVAGREMFRGAPPAQAPGEVVGAGCVAFHRSRRAVCSFSRKATGSS
ncbi:MAG: hypothetical protein BWX84_01424 [Verrucomicrobia bacterium ADurb.Bin118]|nr:MAG: hypothetical protein BWX84_01424 [Verrucomicrobia bacterium ADurb.Bin118]